MKKIIYIVILFAKFYLFAQENKIIKYEFQDKDGFTCNSSLFIVNDESIYRIEDSRKDGVQDENTSDGKFIVISNDSISKIIFSDNKQSITRIPLYKNEIIYKTLQEKNDFVLTGKTKMFNNYNCQEANLDLNGRKYSIWFTQEIEINYGPLKLNGLPGLIVEIYEDTNKTKITLKSIEKLSETVQFEKYKKYIYSKTILDFQKYEDNIISIMCAYKAKKIAKVRELGGEIEFNETQEGFTKLLIDVPSKLVLELKKIN